MGKGNTIIFGKITLSSEIESMGNLVAFLKEVLEKNGYPSDNGLQKEGHNADLKDAEQKLRQLMSHGSEDAQ